MFVIFISWLSMVILTLFIALVPRLRKVIDINADLSFIALAEIIIKPSFCCCVVELRRFGMNMYSITPIAIVIATPIVIASNSLIPR